MFRARRQVRGGPHSQAAFGLDHPSDGVEAGGGLVAHSGHVHESDHYPPVDIDLTGPQVLPTAYEHIAFKSRVSAPIFTLHRSLRAPTSHCLSPASHFLSPSCSLRAQLVAVAVPDPEVLVPWAKERGMPGDLPALCRDPAVNAAVMKSMQEEGRVAKLRGFEQVQGLYLVAEPFTVENGLMTPTFKIKRNVVRDVFTKEVDAMYARLPTS